MDKLALIAMAAAAALICSQPAHASDDWGAPDRISPTVKAEDSQDTAAADTKADTKVQAAAEKKAPAAKQSKAEKAKLKAQEQADADARKQQQADAQAAQQAKATRQTSTSQPQQYTNVLGPLWGVPQDAPVMQHMDPELEKQYAKDQQGRLVPQNESKSGKPAKVAASAKTPAADPQTEPDVEQPQAAASATGYDPYAGVQESQVKGQAEQKPLHKEGKHKFFKNPLKKSKGNKGPKPAKVKKEKPPKEPKPEKQPKAEKVKDDATPADPEASADAKAQADVDRRMRREQNPDEKGW